MQMPATPERVWRTISEATQGAARGADHQDERASPARPSEMTGRHAEGAEDAEGGQG
jgi:hypothetical protein